MTAISTHHLRTDPSAGQAAFGPSGPVSIEGVRSLLGGLDRRQHQAVTHGDGPLLVIAGPGTGKTEVITRRVAWLIASHRARPAEILALTFTERAADEMQSRVDVLVPYGQADTAIHTFHAFGDELLREHGHLIGRPADPRVIGRAEAIVLLRERLFDLELDRLRPLGDPARFLGALVDLFARAKEAGLGPEDLAAYARELQAGALAAAPDTDPAETGEAISALLAEAATQAELARAFAGYQSILAERSLIDHGDQVAEAVRLLQQRADVRLTLRRRFRYVVVDEAQDANPQQLALVRALVGEAGNVTFVGDDDQAIYAFRGAVEEGLAALPASYVTLRHVVLRRNYRSRKPILEAALRLVRHNDPHRLEVQRGVDKTLTAVRRSRRPAPVRHQAYATSADEADAVATHIQAGLARGRRAADYAVLVRTNADAEPVLASLDVRGIPWVFSGASGLLAHREVRDVLSLMRVLASPHSSEDLYAVLAAAPYGLGGEDLSAVCDLANRRRLNLWAVSVELVAQPGLLRLSAGTRERLERCVRDIRRALEVVHEQPAPAALYAFLRDSGWLRLLVERAATGDDAPLGRVARFFEVVSGQADVLSDARLPLVVPALQALIDAGQDPAAPPLDAQGDAVSVLTVHQAKGLEFGTVFVVGLTEGHFPLPGRRDPLELPPALTGRPRRDGPEVQRAEERRLMYVAMTRARDELILSHAAGTGRAGRRRRPSTFLAEALGRPVDDVAESALPRLLDPPPVVMPGTHQSGGREAHASNLTLSFTQVDDYLACPRKYQLRHVVRVPTAPHHALVFGNALHQAVAVVNLAAMRGTSIADAPARATLEAHWKSEGFLSAEHESARFAAGLVALDRFAMRTQSATGERVLAVEQPFAMSLGDVRVRGRFDAVREVAGSTIITDYKSGDVRDPVRARERARDASQLHLYSLAWEAEHGRRPDAVELHFLEGDVIGRVVPTERQLERARQKVAFVAAGVRAGEFGVTPGYPACDWCPYRRICPAAT
jgi:DNA helicase-2/ATP-dependent DNA helicase PcrA